MLSQKHFPVVYQALAPHRDSAACDTCIQDLVSQAAWLSAGSARLAAPMAMSTSAPDGAGWVSDGKGGSQYLVAMPCNVPLVR
jgi:hypothetical protein